MGTGWKVRSAAVACLAVAFMVAVVHDGAGTAHAALRTTGAARPLAGIQKIQHVVILMQENRSFDSYFGTYPGADGIPAGVCVPDKLHGGCVAPFHDRSDINNGGPHDEVSFLQDRDGGKMDGFVDRAETSQNCQGDPTRAGCSPCKTTASACNDVMGYHDAREIPNYWKYAQNYVLQDHMFESVRSWSLPSHLWAVSGWSARCTSPTDPLSCSTFFDQPANGLVTGAPFPWTDITYLLDAHGVSWGYYVFQGTEPDCESDAAMTCAPVRQGPTTPGIWNPLPYFQDVHQDNQLGNIQSLNNFYAALLGNTTSCGLPNVSWLIPNNNVSEHPPSSISAGQAYVTTAVNAIMASPCWDSTAIFVSWDDWGGFYDHVDPPTILTEKGSGLVMSAGYGLRVPGLVISPYAKAGYIDHQSLSHDAYLKFIEDDFLGGEPICAPGPAGTNQGCMTNDGRPDSRPQVSELLDPGNLVNDFNFNQAPRPPLLLPTHPAPGPASCAPGGCSTLRLRVSVPRTVHVSGRNPSIGVAIGCGLACRATVRVVLASHGHSLKLKPQRQSIRAYRSRTVRLRISRFDVSEALYAISKHYRVTATITVTAKAGKKSGAYTRTISVTR